jgi:hypothetical protein
MSRPLLEHTIRRQLKGYRNIIVRDQCRAENVLANSDGGRVRAVECENRDGTREVLAADIVIDASGRGNPTLALLKSIGRPRPEETVNWGELPLHDRAHFNPADCTDRLEGRRHLS